MIAEERQNLFARSDGSGEGLSVLVVGDPEAQRSKLGVGFLCTWSCVPVILQESSDGSKEVDSASVSIIFSLSIVVSAVSVKKGAVVGVVER